MDTRFKHPFTCVVSGPTKSGKSVFVAKFLQNLPVMSNETFERIIFYYGEWQDSYRKNFGRVRVNNDKLYPRYVTTEFHNGLPDPKHYSSDNFTPKLIVLDDLMRQASTGGVVTDIFTRGSHHKNISVIFITQNLFHKGSGQRDISLNANYIVLFKNPRDRAQIGHLARQVFPEDSRFLVEAYHDATVKPHSYLLLDLMQSTPDQLRFRSCIFPDDSRNYAYVPKMKHF